MRHLLSKLLRPSDDELEAKARRLIYSDLNVISNWDVAVIRNIDRRRPKHRQVLRQPEVKTP